MLSNYVYSFLADLCLQNDLFRGFMVCVGFESPSSRLSCGRRFVCIFAIITHPIWGIGVCFYVVEGGEGYPCSTQYECAVLWATYNYIWIGLHKLFSIDDELTSHVSPA